MMEIVFSDSNEALGQGCVKVFLQLIFAGIQLISQLHIRGWFPHQLLIEESVPWCEIELAFTGVFS